MTSRFATVDDCGVLAEMNYQLIRDEGHRNPMNVSQLEERMKGFLAGEYRAVIFEESGKTVAYALYREQRDEIYLGNYSSHEIRGEKGPGRRAVEILRSRIWPRDKRLTVEVLVANKAGVAFWRAAGYTDYALTLEIMPQE